MDATTKQQYDEYLTNVRISNSALETVSLKGKHKKRQEERQNLILKMYDLGQEIKFIATVIEMSEKEVIQILRKMVKIFNTNIFLPGK